VSNRPEDIDRFFKENMEKIDVKFNASHWDKLSHSLISGNIVADHSQKIKKALKIKTTALVGLGIAVVATVCIYHFSNKEPVNSIKNSIKMDSIRKNIYNPETLKSPSTKNAYNLHPSALKLKMDTLINNVQPDSNKKNNIPVLLLPAKKDSVINALKDTVRDHKKEKLNIFW
jgi:hypothetical protein